jgi:hypothetical protein
MPAYNNGPRSTATDPTSAPLANPSLGMPVLMTPFGGPKNSPFDAQMWPSNVWPPAAGSRVNDPNNVSTGGLSTGIGFGPNAKLPGIAAGTFLPAPGNDQSGFTDDYTPGVTTPSGGVAVDGRLLSIGGGKSVVTPVKAGDYSNAPSTPAPYIALPILAFGNGGSRDAGAGPVFTGFSIKLVTAAADIAAAAAIETGYQNRSGVTVKSGASQFGSNTTSSPVVA